MAPSQELEKSSGAGEALAADGLPRLLGLIDKDLGLPMKVSLSSLVSTCEDNAQESLAVALATALDKTPAVDLELLDSVRAKLLRRQDERWLQELAPRSAPASIAPYVLPDGMVAMPPPMATTAPCHAPCGWMPPCAGLSGVPLPCYVSWIQEQAAQAAALAEAAAMQARGSAGVQATGQVKKVGLRRHIVRLPENPLCAGLAGEGRDEVSQLALHDVVQLAHCQAGSRLLQAALDEAKGVEMQKIFFAILPHTANLASDTFGHFVVQKLFDVMKSDQCGLVVAELRGHVFKLSNDSCGCRVMQKALQRVPRESQELLACELKRDVVRCIQNPHGNHVIQKCIEQMVPDSVSFIIKAVEGQTELIATHIYGCRVIQRLLEHCPSQLLEGVLDDLIRHLPKLASDAYGNYVVQHMLERGRLEDKRRILTFVCGNIVELSVHQCSSSVVEKCFDIATVGEHAPVLRIERAELMRTLLAATGDSPSPLRCMIGNRFGNFIVQRAVEHSRGSARARMRKQILEVRSQLCGSASGKRILVALRKDRKASE